MDNDIIIKFLLSLTMIYKYSNILKNIFKFCMKICKIHRINKVGSIKVIDPRIETTRKTRQKYVQNIVLVIVICMTLEFTSSHGSINIEAVIFN